MKSACSKKRTCNKTKKHKGNKKIFNISSTTPLDNKQYSMEVLNNIKSNKKENSTTRKTPLTRSFSPQVNRNLITMTNQIATAAPIAECMNKKTYGANVVRRNFFSEGKTHKLNKGYLVNIGSILAPKCVKFNTKRAKKVLLDNFSKSKHINCEHIIAPKQYDSNCWFNTMFVAFFISDKGRKFFRFFRQLMIEGKTLNGKKFNPLLQRAFFLFNLSIEACYNLGNKPLTRDIAKSLDTNNIIFNIWNSLPVSARKTAIVGKHKSSNPLNFYQTLIEYLGAKEIILKRISSREISPLLTKKNGSFESKHLETIINTSQKPKAPDIIALVIYDADTLLNKQLDYTITVDKAKIKYVLDSAIIRDTTGNHFCCTLTCGGQEMGFDGASYSKIAPFIWKNKINKNIKWTFKGSVWAGKEKGKSIKWNFNDGYQILFYYRND